MSNLSRKLLVYHLLVIFALAAFAQPPAHNYSKDKARPVVDWARDGVIYEVWERAFSPAGDFNGVTARLDDLKKTGVTILWLMPVNPIGEKGKKGSIGSPYAIRDYYGVNPAYGTADDLKRLVKEAHARDMKVIVDVVFNHTAWDNKLITEHPEFYHRDAKGDITYPYDWTDIAWLDYSKPELRRYITDVMKYWIKEYGLDGLRCDVAGLIPVDFWEAARAELEQVKPGLFLLAEAEEPNLMVKAFDSDYAWEMMHAIDDAFLGRKPATAIREAWEKEKARFPQGTLPMRMTDDHDESRAVVRLGIEGALAAQSLVFTLDGIPLVYNGQEVCDSAESGDPALFEKVPIVWGIGKRRPECARFYRKMLVLRKEYPALRRGELTWVENSAPEKVVTFLRHKGKDNVLVVASTTNVAVTVTFAVPKLKGAMWMDVTPGLKTDARTSPTTLEGQTVQLAPWGVRIFGSWRLNELR
jgi:cyclomaltodextrinase